MFTNLRLFSLLYLLSYIVDLLAHRGTTALGDHGCSCIFRWKPRGGGDLYSVSLPHLVSLPTQNRFRSPTAVTAYIYSSLAFLCRMFLDKFFGLCGGKLEWISVLDLHLHFFSLLFCPFYFSPFSVFIALVVNRFSNLRSIAKAYLRMFDLIGRPVEVLLSWRHYCTLEEGNLSSEEEGWTSGCENNGVQAEQCRAPVQI